MEDIHHDLVTDRKGTQYCLKIDIKKFYDNVDHEALKRIIRYMIADEQMLRLLDKVIDSNGKEKSQLKRVYITKFYEFKEKEEQVYIILIPLINPYIKRL